MRSLVVFILISIFFQSNCVAFAAPVSITYSFDIPPGTSQMDDRQGSEVSFPFPAQPGAEVFNATAYTSPANLNLPNATSFNLGDLSQSWVYHDRYPENGGLGVVPFGGGHGDNLEAFSGGGDEVLVFEYENSFEFEILSVDLNGEHNQNTNLNPALFYFDGNSFVEATSGATSTQWAIFLNEEQGQAYIANIEVKYNNPGVQQVPEPTTLLLWSIIGVSGGTAAMFRKRRAVQM